MSNDLDEIPPEINSAFAWYGPDMHQNREWLITLSDTDIAEIELAVAGVIAAGVEIVDIGRDDFPLPGLGARLREYMLEVLNGRGFVLLRGLPVWRWTRRESAIAFWGLGAHMGPARSQNAAGHALGHVRDLGLSGSDPNVRIYQTHERQTFHTDSADIVGLLCLQTAQSGGLSALVSSVTVFNEMRRRRPDLLRLLFAPVATDRRGEIPPGQKPWFEIPVFNWHAGLLSAIYQRQYVDSAQRFPEARRLTSELKEALDLFDDLTNDPALHFFMEFRPGDVQLVHNHTMLHDRTAFTDWPEPERRRHLLRLWLAPVEARPLPAVFAQRYGSVTPGARGGLNMPGVPLIAPLEAA
ncbi:MAG: TauD/TfdA family dioxygenase [Blastocatellia bacterium]